MKVEKLSFVADELPKPLSNIQLNVLLDKVNHGDEVAIKTVAEHNIRLVLYEVNSKFSLVEYDKEDLVSFGNIGLLKAIKTFDKSKNVEFVVYALKCIDNEILMFLRKNKKYQNVDSLDRVVKYTTETDNSEWTLKDIISDEINIVEEYEIMEEYQALRQIIDELPKQAREVIMLYFGFYDNKTYTQREIAEIMALSQSYVSRLILKSIKRIGQQLNQESFIVLRQNQGEIEKPKKNDEMTSKTLKKKLANTRK